MTILALAVDETVLTSRQLQRSGSGADRLVVRTGGNCHRNPEREVVLFESQDASTIRKVAGGLSFRPELLAPYCRCCGDVTFDFYNGSTLQLTFSLHHGCKVRIPEKGDRALSSTSVAALASWMKQVGIAHKLEELKKKARQIDSDPSL